MGKSIIQVELYTRVFIKLYSDVTKIDVVEYDIKEVEKCCRGIIPYHGGLYSTTGFIWRYVRDIPYLKPNFDFADIVAGRPIFSQAREDYELRLEYMKIFMSDRAIDFDDSNIKDIDNYEKLKKLMYNDSKERIIVQALPNGDNENMYLDTTMIPSIFDTSNVTMAIQRGYVYKGYKWFYQYV